MYFCDLIYTMEFFRLSQAKIAYFTFSDPIKHPVDNLTDLLIGPSSNSILSLTHTLE
jgi:hypothetical protein